MSLRKEMEARIKVRVDVPPNGERQSLCGEPLQTDGQGDFFVLPAHQGDYIKQIFPSYRVGEEFEEQPARKPRAKAEE